MLSPSTRSSSGEGSGFSMVMVIAHLSSTWAMTRAISGARPSLPSDGESLNESFEGVDQEHAVLAGGAMARQSPVTASAVLVRGEGNDMQRMTRTSAMPAGARRKRI